MSLRSHTSPWTNVRFRSSLYSLRLFGFPAYVSLSTTTTSSSPAASRRRTKQLPMKPMPPVTTSRAMTSSLHLDVPIVWDVLRIVGDVELIRVFVVVQLRGKVHEVHRFRSNRLETVDNVRRDLDQYGVPLAGKELVHLAFRQGPVAIVVADDLGRPAHHDEMIRLLLVVVPALHDPGVPDCDVRFREPFELRPIGGEHFHEVTPLVVNLFERPDDDALNQIHGGLPVRRAATYSFTSKGLCPTPLCGRRGARAREKERPGKEAGPGPWARLGRGVGAAFAHIRRNYVFKGRGPATEDTEPHPLNAYGETKLFGERVVRKAHAEPIILRLSSVFGWNRLSSKTNAVTWILQKLEAGQEGPLFSGQKGTPTYAKTAAEVAFDLWDHQISGLFHVSCPDCASRVEMGRAVADVFRISNPRLHPIPLGSVALRAKRPLAPCLVVRKVEETLKRPMPTFRACLEDMKATR